MKSYEGSRTRTFFLSMSSGPLHWVRVGFGRRIVLSSQKKELRRMKHGVDETVLPGQISSGEGPAGLPDLFWSFFLSNCGSQSVSISLLFLKRRLVGG